MLTNQKNMLYKTSKRCEETLNKQKSKILYDETKAFNK